MSDDDNGDDGEAEDDGDDGGDGDDLPTYQSTQASCTRAACKLLARTHARRRRRM